MIVWALLLLGAAFESDGTLEQSRDITIAATQAWDDTAKVFAKASGVEVAPMQAPILLRRAVMAANHSGASRVRQILLRQGPSQGLDVALQVSLRHEVAHQLLLHACPAASNDRLLHEAFAVSVSGELAAWASGPYLSLTQALATLERAPSLDAPRARAALARLLQDHPQSQALAEGVGRRLRLCALDAYPRDGMQISELMAVNVGEDALVVLSRHSGEVLEATGAVHQAMPFGSLLKPFIAAAHRVHAPVLAVRPLDATWQCHRRGMMPLDEALVKSCNGYFLDWNVAAPLGVYDGVLQRLGLGRSPANMQEAMGLKTSLVLSPWALAQAYRLLAETSPQTLASLRDTARTGTLAQTQAARFLRGWSIKTGTVRDAASRPSLGWLAAVNDDLVIIVAAKGQAPSKALPRLIEAAHLFAGRAELVAAHVVVFNVLGGRDVQLNCASQGLVVGSDVATPMPKGAVLGTLRDGESAVCLGQPWRATSARFATNEKQRLYAGVLRAEGAGAYSFRTTLGLYTAGVMHQEDASIRGPAADALARVIAHNAQHGRHPARRPCDTTHCQVFHGTPAQRVDAVTALRRGPLPYTTWLHFSRGGTERWQQRRARKAVEAALGSDVSALHFVGGRVQSEHSVGALYDDARSTPCELLRNPLHLPSCPQQATLGETWVEFTGVGEGHGVGLDVQWAKQSGLSETVILERAFQSTTPQL